LDLAAASVTAALSALVVSKKIGLLSEFQSQPWLLLAAGIVGLDLFALYCPSSAAEDACDLEVSLCASFQLRG